MLASLKYSLQCLILTVCTTLLNREEEGSGVWIQSGISVKNKIQISYGKCFANRCATSADLANTGDLAHSKHRMQKCHEQLQIIRGVGGGEVEGVRLNPPFGRLVNIIHFMQGLHSCNFHAPALNCAFVYHLHFK